MTRTQLAVLLAAFLMTVAILPAQTPPPTAAPVSPLDEVSKLKADNLKLRAQVLDLQRTLASLQIEKETAQIDSDRQALEASFRTLLKPAAGATFDWATLTFKPPDPPAASNGAPKD